MGTVVSPLSSTVTSVCDNVACLRFMTYLPTVAGVSSMDFRLFGAEERDSDVQFIT